MQRLLLVAMACAGLAWGGSALGADVPAGDHAAGHGPKYELLSIDVAAAIWSIVVFVIVVIVLRAFAFKPIQQALANREQFITTSLADAKRDREEAEARLAEYKAQLDRAQSEAGKIVEEGRRNAESLKRSIQDEARTEADRMIERARKEIDLARESAVRELYTLGAQLATDAAGRIIGRELNPADHERLIAESIAELGRGVAKNN